MHLEIDPKKLDLQEQMQQTTDTELRLPDPFDLLS
jgi:hypothetical protein